MTKKDFKDVPTVIVSDQVKEAMEQDPDLAEAIRSFSASARQVMEGVASGKYVSFDEGMEKVTGEKPVPLFGDSDE